MRFAAITGAMLALFAAAGPAWATPEPRLKPSPPHYSTLLSAADFARLRDGLRAASDGRWDRVITLESQLTDPTARRILLWRRATSDTNTGFGELSDARTRFVGWPRHNDIIAEAEADLAEARLSSSTVIDWFGDNEPVSGAGHVALADALFSAGRTDEAQVHLLAAWRGSTLDNDLQDRVLANFRHRLTQEDHEARVDFLLWLGQRTAARRLFPHISSGHRALAEARIALASRARGVDTAIDAVPSSLTEHPGLLYERAVWRRRSRLVDEAEPLIRAIPRDLEPAAARLRVWDERNIHIRRAIERGNYSAAYEMAAANGMSSGVDFAEAEFLAGWLALRHVGRPADAAIHFERLEAGVTTPISTARARYWRGRAAEALGQPAEATAFYVAAAEYPTVYYGQLAAARLDGAHRVSAVPPSVEPTDEERAEFAARDTVRALRMLADLDEQTLFRELSYSYDDELTEPAEFVMLAEIAREYGQDGVGVRAGKAGLARGVVVPNAAYPMMALDNLAAGAPERAFILALTRQESEFYQRAVSHAGARGLMQLMPATARLTARQIGAQYQMSWLTDDPEYNVRLGSAHLADLMIEFQGSYVLVAAAYNAGGSRARQWISRNGDPRRPGADVVDWVEAIPFSETRDYVQRVLENTQVYRGLLNGGELQIALDNDLRRGAY